MEIFCGVVVEKFTPNLMPCHLFSHKYNSFCSRERIKNWYIVPQLRPIAPNNGVPANETLLNPDFSNAAKRQPALSIICQIQHPFVLVFRIRWAWTVITITITTITIINITISIKIFIIINMSHPLFEKINSVLWQEYDNSLRPDFGGNLPLL